MSTIFDTWIEEISKKPFYSGRGGVHCKALALALEKELLERSPALRTDRNSGLVRSWTRRTLAATRGRHDLLCGPADVAGEPAPGGLRICIDVKTVVTAHRNGPTRAQELRDAAKRIAGDSPESLHVAVVLVGTEARYLNVADQVAALYRKMGKERFFDESIVPRLSTGDESLWTDCAWGISPNKPNDAATTAALFLGLTEFDALFVAPVHIDNVTPPKVDRAHPAFGRFDEQYEVAMASVVGEYMKRWG